MWCLCPAHLTGERRNWASETDLGPAIEIVYFLHITQILVRPSIKALLSTHNLNKPYLPVGGGSKQPDGRKHSFWKYKRNSPLCPADAGEEGVEEESSRGMRASSVCRRAIYEVSYKLLNCMHF